MVPPFSLYIILLLDTFGKICQRWLSNSSSGPTDVQSIQTQMSSPWADQKELPNIKNSIENLKCHLEQHRLAHSKTVMIDANVATKQSKGPHCRAMQQISMPSKDFVKLCHVSTCTATRWSSVCRPDMGKAIRLDLKGVDPQTQE